MKKNFCTLLALCLTLCTVFYVPVMAADKEKNNVQPRGNGGVWKTVTDQAGYKYNVYGATIIGGNRALVSTEYYLTDHQMVTPEHKEEIAAQVKGLSAYTDIWTYNNATDSFGGTGFYVGASNSIKYSKTYYYNVLLMNGKHGFGCDGVPDYRFTSSANQ